MERKYKQQTCIPHQIEYANQKSESSKPLTIFRYQLVEDSQKDKVQ